MQVKAAKTSQLNRARSGKTSDLTHLFVSPEPIDGKPTPDRCADCGNARGTIYHGQRDEEPFGHCDTCGAILQQRGECPVDASHTIAIPYALRAWAGQERHVS